MPMAAVDSAPWNDACKAAAILAVDPAGIGGICLRSRAGIVRDRWLSLCVQMFPRTCRWLRAPLNVSDGRLLGGLDLAATLQAGRPIAEQGILVQANGGVITLPMAERISVGTAAKIGCVMDQGEVILERDGFGRRVPTRFAVIALDEGIEPDERPPCSLLERLALHIDLDGVPPSITQETRHNYDILRARNALARIRTADEVYVALCELAAALGINSARAVGFALRVARAKAALDARPEVEEEDIAAAARWVFIPRARAAPPDSMEAESSGSATQPDSPQSTQPQRAPPSEAPSVPNASQAEQRPQSLDPPTPQSGGPETPFHADRPSPTSADPQSPNQTPQSGQGATSLSQRVLAAAKASLPAHFLSQLQPANTRNAGSQHAGRAGAMRISQSRGTPAGSQAGELRPGARINLIETLRAAAPWQLIRRRAAERLAADRGRPTARSAASTPQVKKPTRSRKPPLIRVTQHDLRIYRFIRHTRTTTIFLVDASGSSALNRLAEVKGAVELMLAESYVRRDRVALISFRGAAAQILLPPTNSLVRAKRELSSLPGGGGTPLATGIDAARVLADSLKRRGESPMVVVLTDGRPNITRDGRGNRLRAESDAVSAARMMRSNSIASLMVDTAPQPRPLTERFAIEMGARYVPLPYANAGSLATVVSQCGRSSHA